MAGNDKIDARLTLILTGYDRQLNGFYMFLGLLVVGSVILLFFLFKTGYNYSLWKSILWTLISSVGVLIALGILSQWAVSSVVYSAKAKFDLHFPQNSPRRNMAIAALSQFKSESNIEKELLEALPEYKTGYAGQTESPPDDQLEQALDQIQVDSNGPSAKSPAQEQSAKQPLSSSAKLKQAINPYGRILLQPTKKIMTKKRDRAEKEKFIMLDPKTKNE